MTLTLLLIELGLLITAAFVLCRHWDAPRAEAAALASLLPLPLLAAGFELSFLLGAPMVMIATEALLCIAAVVLIFRLGGSPKGLLRDLKTVVANHPTATAAAFAATILLGLQAFGIQLRLNAILPSATIPTTAALGSQSAHPLPPGNIETLPLWLLRFHAVPTGGVLALAAFVSIVFATYALARRYA